MNVQDPLELGILFTRRGVSLTARPPRQFAFSNSIFWRTPSRAIDAIGLIALSSAIQIEGSCAPGNSEATR
jgi:hypothetical protein